VAEEPTGLSRILKGVSKVARNPLLTALQLALSPTPLDQPQEEEWLEKREAGSEAFDESKIEEIFVKDIEAIGATSDSTDRYSSFDIPMTKDKFFENVIKLPKDDPKQEHTSFLVEQIKRGRKIGLPNITLKWTGNTWKPAKESHEGRRRMLAAEKVFGSDAKIPVNVQLRNKAGNKIPIDELTGERRYYTVKDADEAEKMLDELGRWKELLDAAPVLRLKATGGVVSKGGSVTVRNPYDYQPRAI